jgi:23S rRNA pseudouridine1911/1915/1917 synthase
MKLTIGEKMSLIEALVQLSPESSMTTLRSWLKEGRVLVDGAMQKLSKLPLEKGQVVSLAARFHYIQGNVQILYEDAHLVVVDKPEGLLSVAAAFEKVETVHGFLKVKYRPRRVFPVHRLDQETSGVMLFALSEKGRDALKEMFVKHEIERLYTAIVEGKVFPDCGTWTSYQFEDRNYHVHNTSDSNKGKFALTHYTVKNFSNLSTWLELKLETGRKNQIRAHCQMVGHPVAGDKKYGATLARKRVYLHAHYLSFFHPINGKKMEFYSPVPESFFRMIPGLERRHDHKHA